jgi:hypothetical protein
MIRTSSAVVLSGLGLALLVGHASIAQQQPAQQATPPGAGRFQLIDADKDSAVVFDGSTGTIHVLDDLERAWTFNPVTNTIGGGLPPEFSADRPAFREQLCENAADAIKREDWAALRECVVDPIGKRPDLATWAAGLGQADPDEGASVSKRWLLKRARFEMQDGSLRIAGIE